MREADFRAMLAERRLEPAQVEAAVDAVREMSAGAAAGGETIESMPVELLQRYIAELIAAGTNSVERLIALARYVYLVGRNDLYVHMLGLIGGRTVLPSIADRTAELAGESTRDAVFAAVPVPPLGSPQSDYPAAVAALLDALESRVDGQTVRHILAGNHHRVPREAFLAHKAIYEEHGLDAVLAHRHASLVAELEEHARTGKPWYEQMITPEVVEMVRANPEIQSGVRDGDYIYLAKIPYAPVEFLRTSDPKLRRYFQCHCTLARASIVEDTPIVDPLFCYCSAGFEKLPFDVIFDQPVEVEVLETALAGDERCRFRVRIPEGAPPVVGAPQD